MADISNHSGFSRRRISEELLVGLRKNSEVSDINLDDPGLKLPDGTINQELVDQRIREVGERNMAKHAELLSRYMVASDLKYMISVPIKAVVRKTLKDKSRQYQVEKIKIHITSVDGGMSVNADGREMTTNGYRVVVYDGVASKDLTDDVRDGKVEYRLRDMMGAPDYLYVRLVRNGNLGQEIVWESSVAFIETTATAGTIIENPDSDKVVLRFRGAFDDKADYYSGDTLREETGDYERSIVEYFGCQWLNEVTGTHTPPLWNGKAWSFYMGDSAFRVNLLGGPPAVNPKKFSFTLLIDAKKYNQDVIDAILAEDITWTRYTEDSDGTQRKMSDNIWNARRGGSGKSIYLSEKDLDSDINGVPSVCIFTAHVTLRDGEGDIGIQTLTATYGYDKRH